MIESNLQSGSLKQRQDPILSLCLLQFATTQPRRLCRLQLRHRSLHIKVVPLPENSRVSSGGIAGAVVAILAGIALCLCVFLLFRRKWARAQELKSPKNGSRPVSPILYKPELAADRQPPQEMPSAEDPSLAIAPYEMLEESSHQELPVDGSLCLIHEMPAATPGRRHFRTA